MGLWMLLLKEKKYLEWWRKIKKHCHSSFYKWLCDVWLKQQRVAINEENLHKEVPFLSIALTLNCPYCNCIGLTILFHHWNNFFFIKHRQGKECVHKKTRLQSRKLLITQSAKKEHKMKSITTTQVGKSIRDSSPEHTQRQVPAEISLGCEWIAVFKADACTHTHSSVSPMATEWASLSG